MKKSTERKGGPYRSTNQMVSGVCAGLAEHFGIAPFWARIGAVVLFFVAGPWPTLSLYIVASILMKPSPALPFRSEGEQDFYDAYTRAPKYTVHHIYEKFQNIERRVRRMEDSVTTRAYEWDRKFHG